MPWQETRVMDAKMSFIVDWQREAVTFAALCRRHAVSRKAGYALIARYTSEGPAGLLDRSRAPHSHPNAVCDAVVEQVLAERRRHPTWGPKKIRASLARHHPGLRWPAESTIGVLLDRHGLSRPRRRRRRVAPAGRPLSPCVAPNDVWGIDFKGWFRTGDGQRCDPLSLSDLATRYVLRLQALESMEGDRVWRVLDTAFREYGAPKVIRSDNGTPFASLAAGGLSQLAVRLIKVGVVPERIDPGKPQQNGRHERLHGTVKAETASPPAASRRAQQRRFDSFRRTFNEERPHEALGQTPPADHYHPAPSTYSGRLRSPEYPDSAEVRRVRHNGEIKWRGDLVFVSRVLTGEPVGVEETEEGDWLVRYGPVVLGILTPNGELRRCVAGVHPRNAAQPKPQG